MGTPKTVVITEAGSGLGRALAHRLADDGDHVMLLERTLAKVEEAAEELGERATALAFDFADPEPVRTAFSRIAAMNPLIDALVNVNNAAVFEPSTIADASDDHILRTIGTNPTVAMFCSRAAIPMLARSGHIVVSEV